MGTQPLRVSPSRRVVDSFAEGLSAVPLCGGMGMAWRAGDVVLKPGVSEDEGWCLAETHAGLPEIPDCRFQRPIPAPDPPGGWVIDGWAGWRWIEGETDPMRAREIVLAGRAYHGLLAPLACDPALVARGDPWARADRVAWGEAPADYPAEYQDMLDPLLAGVVPDLPAQRVHGDLTGNVVFAPGLAPGIIDPTLYWRPAAFAEAVVLVDQCWFAATLDLAPFTDTPALAAMLRRAAARRIAEQPEQVAAFGKDAGEALATARRIAAWSDAALGLL